MWAYAGCLFLREKKIAAGPQDGGVEQVVAAQGVPPLNLGRQTHYDRTLAAPDRSSNPWCESAAGGTLSGEVYHGNDISPINRLLLGVKFFDTEK